jgi:hypothetical protein
MTNLSLNPNIYCIYDYIEIMMKIAYFVESYLAISNVRQVLILEYSFVRPLLTK